MLLGVSSRADVRGYRGRFFTGGVRSQHSERSHGVDYAFAQTGNNELYNTEFSIDFTLNDAGVLDLLEVYMFELQDWLPTDTYELPHLLAQMGAPSEAYLSVRMTAARVYLSLIYEDARTIITYTFRLGRSRGPPKPPSSCVTAQSPAKHCCYASWRTTSAPCGTRSGPPPCAIASSPWKR